ncbi:MAG: hypothetical protein LBJ00_00230, partial [Planctomycetaceae bacterium]|nr:hypothetical protein [Planctomycetaceae bacterium]
MMNELTPIFDVDGELFSSARFIWFLLRYDLLVVKTMREIGGVKKQLDSIAENFEHKLQRSLPRPEIITGNDEIKTVDIFQVSEPDDDQLYKRLKQLEAAAVNVNWYQKTGVAKINIPELLENCCNEKSIGESYSTESVPVAVSILRLNVVGQGGGKFSVIFQGENLYGFKKGWFGIGGDGIILYSSCSKIPETEHANATTWSDCSGAKPTANTGFVMEIFRVNTNIFYEILN